jgi:hypothetical protein
MTIDAAPRARGAARFRTATHAAPDDHASFRVTIPRPTW